MGRTLPTTPTNRPTSTRLPDQWTSSQDGARRLAVVIIVRSQRPVTAGRTGSWAARGIDSRQVVTPINQERTMLPLSRDTLKRDGSRLSCGALKEDSFHNLRVPP